MNYRITQNLVGVKQVRHHCPNCGVGLVNPLAEAGQRDSCPECRVAFVVPGEKELAKEDLRKEHAKAEEKRIATEKAARKRAASEAKKQAPVQVRQPVAFPIQPVQRSNQGSRAPSDDRLFVSGALGFSTDITKSAIAIAIMIVSSLLLSTILINTLAAASRGVQLLLVHPDFQPALLTAFFLHVYAVIGAVGLLFLSYVLTGIVGVFFKIEENGRSR